MFDLKNVQGGVFLPALGKVETGANNKKNKGLKYFAKKIRGKPFSETIREHHVLIKPF